MKNAILLAAVVHYFTSYPDSNGCHATSDMQLFHEKTMAQAHADSTLQDGKVDSFDRAQLATYEAELGKAKPAAKGYAEMTKADLVKLATERELEFDKKATKEDLVKLLEDADAAGPTE